MKNIFLIFKRDVRKICSNYVALIVAIGLIFLPSLYAWFNIDASWDPYGNTKGIKVAVSSKDKGISLEGDVVNIGDNVIENLKANEDIGWEFVEEKQAIDGVYSGEYYAAIVIPEDFSEGIGSILTGEIQKPKLEYYVNEKKNAIAPKITDKGVSTLQNTINQTFVKEASKAVFTVLNLSDKAFQAKGIDPVEDILNLLKSTKTNLQDFSVAVDSFGATAKAVGSLVEASQLLMPDMKSFNQNGINQLEDIQDTVFVGEALGKQLANSVSTIVVSVEDNISETNKDLSKIIDNLADLGDSNYEQLISIKSKLEKIYNLNSRLSVVLGQIKETAKILGLKTTELDKAINKIDQINVTITNQEQNIQKLGDLIKSGSEVPQSLIKDINSSINDINSNLKTVADIYENQVEPIIRSGMTSSFAGMGNLESILNQLNSTMPKVTGAMDKTKNAIENSVVALENTDILVQKGIIKIDSIVTELESVEKDERFAKLVEIIKNDPELAGDFMSSPVLINTNEIYPIENYGSAMSPFYSILAIWVGALILAAILKCKVEEDENIKDLKPYEIYFGRYLIFMTMGILQAVVICLGDIYGLGIQCLEPAKFIFAGAFASVVFTMIVYTLTISFGDVGKAIAVVFMVIQVAGAGGTFPIEVTPGFFRAVNPFLPFTFGINAMRECVAGIYENAYMIDLLKLGVYIPISLVIGLVLRKPIINLKEFFEEKLEKTGLM